MVSGPDSNRVSGRDRAAVQACLEGRRRKKDRGFREDLELGADERHLEGGGPDGIAEERVPEGERLEVHRAPGRYAVDFPPAPGHALDARQGAGSDHSEERRARAGRRHRLPGGLENRAAALEVLAGDRLEPDGVSRQEKRRRIPRSLEEPHRGAADQSPAAGRLAGIDPRQRASDSHTSGRHARARRGQAGGVELAGKTPQVRKARSETEESHSVVGARVTARELLGGEPCLPGELGKVGPDRRIRAVEDRDSKHAAGGAVRRAGVAAQDPRESAA